MRSGFTPEGGFKVDTADTTLMFRGIARPEGS